MAAGLGYKEFSTGDVLTAADANGYLASQVVMVFASAAARTSAIASPQEGMISYLKDTNSTEYYSGSAWVAIGGSAGGMTLINAGGTALTGATTTVSTIPDTYKSLYVVVKGVYNAGDVVNGFRFNGDSGSNYSYNWMRTVGETYSAGSLNGTTSIAGAFSGSSSTAKNTGAMLLEIPRYADSDWVNFYWSSWSGADGSTTVNRQGVGVYDGSAAISSITFISTSSTFSGGTAYVYGVN